MHKFKIEVCAFSVQSAVNAAKAGAYRVELCDNYLEGGTTPSFGTIESTRRNISIRLNVLIRPRGGDFLYSDLEFDTMLRDIKMVKQLGANGIAAGVLTSDGLVDVKRMKEIISVARPMSVTFHRAFDCTAEPFDSLNALIELGVDRVLTSGTKKTALEGKETIAGLVEKAAGRIVVMPGSGINESNIIELVIGTKAKEYHLSGKNIVPGGMTFLNKEAGFNPTLPAGAYIESDISKIKAVVDIIKKF